MSPELAAILGTALAILIASSLTFGHRYNDRGSKMNETTRTEELHALRVELRSETTLPVIEKIWQFLLQAEGKRYKEGQPMDVESVYYDTDLRVEFNKLLNELEKTFGNSINIRDTWFTLRKLYGRVGNTLYLFGITSGVGGYSLLISSLDDVNVLSQQHMSILTALYVIGLVILLAFVLLLRQKIESYISTYQKAKDQYLINEVRIQN